MQDKIYEGVLKKYTIGDESDVWKIEKSQAALNIYVTDKEAKILTDLDIGRKVYFKLKTVFLGREYGNDYNANVAYNLRFEINT